jgi:hypothetical protein
MNHAFTRSIHILFFILSIAFAIRQQFDQGLIYGGIALAFDPFNANEKWSDRPIWQRCILLSELFFVLLCLVLTFLKI